MNDFDEMQRWIDNIRRIAKLPRLCAQPVADVVEQELSRTMGAGQAPDGTPHIPRQSDGAAPLTGAAAAMRVTAVGSQVIVLIRGPEALHHLQRARGGIERRLIPIGRLPSNLARLVAAACAKQFAETVNA